MRKLRKVQKNLQPQIDLVIESLLKDSKYNCKGIFGYIADVRSGWAGFDGQFTVPLWAYDRRYKNISYHGGKDYFIYYVAHELAHQLRYKKYGTDGTHDFRFYKIFMDICPKELQHFELNYKPSSAKYGIKKPS